MQPTPGPASPRAAFWPPLAQGVVDLPAQPMTSAHEASSLGEPERLYKVGERVQLTQGPFAGIEGIYQMADGDRRVMVLIELMSKKVAVPVEMGALRKLG